MALDKISKALHMPVVIFEVEASHVQPLTVDLMQVLAIDSVESHVREELDGLLLGVASGVELIFSTSDLREEPLHDAQILPHRSEPAVLQTLG